MCIDQDNIKIKYHVIWENIITLHTDRVIGVNHFFKMISTFPAAVIVDMPNKCWILKVKFFSLISADLTYLYLTLIEVEKSSISQKYIYIISIHTQTKHKSIIYSIVLGL